MTRARVMVLGAGAWGVALANVAAFEARSCRAVGT